MFEGVATFVTRAVFGLCHQSCRWCDVMIRFPRPCCPSALYNPANGAYLLDEKVLFGARVCGQVVATDCFLTTRISKSLIRSTHMCHCVRCFSLWGLHTRVLRRPTCLSFPPPSQVQFCAEGDPRVPRTRHNLQKYPTFVVHLF